MAFSVKLKTRFTVLLAQMLAGYKFYKLKNGTRRIPYLLYQRNKLTKICHNNLIT